MRAKKRTENRKSNFEQKEFVFEQVEDIQQKACFRCKEIKDVREFRMLNGKRMPTCSACYIEGEREARYRKKMGIATDHAVEKAERERLFQEGLIYCPNCKENKPFSCFYTNRSRANGYSNYCKKCCPIVDARGEHRRATVEKFATILPAEVKTCYSCKQTKSVEEFRPRRRGDPLRGRVSDCNDCAGARGRINYHKSSDKKKHLIALRKHNITAERYQEMLEEQGGVCAICKQKETRCDPRTGLTRRLSIDHCHTSGIIRQLLCGRCNMMIGLAQDNPELLVDAINYINRHHVQ